MFELLFSSPKLAGAIGAVLAVLASVVAAFVKGRRTGRGEEQLKQAKAAEKAAAERQDMRQEGGAIEQDVKSMTDKEAHEEALKWARKSSQ